MKIRKAYLTGAGKGLAIGTVIGLCCWALWALWAHYRYGGYAELHLMMFAGVFLGFALGVQYSTWRFKAVRLAHGATSSTHPALMQSPPDLQDHHP